VQSQDIRESSVHVNDIAEKYLLQVNEHDLPDSLKDMHSLQDVGSESPETLRRQPPITPSFAQKNKRLNQFMSDFSSGRKVPASIMKQFGTKDALAMSLSQAFGETQHDTSPNGPKSDPVFDRPSPAFIHATASPTSPLFNTGLIPLNSDFGFSAMKRRMERLDSDDIDRQDDVPDVTQVDSKGSGQETESYLALPTFLSSKSDQSSSPGKQVLASQADVQVPRSSKTHRSAGTQNAVHQATLPAEKIDATPIDRLHHDEVYEPSHKVEEDDAIVDSEMSPTRERSKNRSFQKQPRSPLKQLPGDPDDVPLFGPDTLEMMTSTPPRPPNSSLSKEDRSSEVLRSSGREINNITPRKPSKRKTQTSSSKRSRAKFEEDCDRVVRSTDSQVSDINPRKRLMKLSGIAADPSQKDLQQMSLELDHLVDLYESEKAYNDVVYPASSDFALVLLVVMTWLVLRQFPLPLFCLILPPVSSLCFLPLGERVVHIRVVLWQAV